MHRALRSTVVAALILSLTACEPTGIEDTGQPPNAPQDGCGAGNACRDESGEGYQFTAVVDVKTEQLKGNVWVTVQDDRDGTMRTRLNRLAPISGGYRVTKRPERDILMIVKVTDDAGTPIFAAGRGSVMCKIEYFGGAHDGDIIDVALSGQTLQEVRCLKPKGQ